MTELIRIMIADDHFVVRKGLAALLLDHHQMQVVGEAATGREAVELARTLHPDVILMDMMMPEMEGPQAIALIMQANPEARILVLASFGENAKVVAAVQAGALGYLLKDSSPDELLDAIRRVYQGNLFLPKELASALKHPQAKPVDIDQLTEREIDVLRLLAAGQSNQAIAQNLSITATTVRSHVSSILAKFNVANRTQAALIAHERQLILGSWPVQWHQTVIANQERLTTKKVVVMQNQPLTTVVVVSRPGVLQHALLTAVRTLPSHMVVGCVGDGLNALSVVALRQPNLVVIDANLLDDEVAALLIELKRKQPPPGCLVLRYSSQHEQLLLAAGADAVMQRDTSTQELEQTLRKVARVSRN